MQFQGRGIVRDRKMFSYTIFPYSFIPFASNTIICMLYYASIVQYLFGKFNWIYTTTLFLGNIYNIHNFHWENQKNSSFILNSYSRASSNCIIIFLQKHRHSQAAPVNPFQSGEPPCVPS